MTMRRAVVTVLVCAAVMWIVAGLWHNLILPGLYAKTHASHDGIGVLLVAYLVLSALMVLLYRPLLSGRSQILNGLLFGAFIGVLWVFPHELAMVGAHGKSLTYVLKNAAWHIVEQGLGGLVIGLLLAQRTSARPPLLTTPERGPDQLEA